MFSVSGSEETTSVEPSSSDSEEGKKRLFGDVSSVQEQSSEVIFAAAQSGTVESSSDKVETATVSTSSKAETDSPEKPDSTSSDFVFGSDMKNRITEKVFKNGDFLIFFCLAGL